METARDISKAIENFEDFLSIYFDEEYDKRLFTKWEHVIYEILLYFEDGRVGGYSSYYCKETWNDWTLENDADLNIFDLLFEIDIQNGADKSKIFHSLCRNGAFEAIKVNMTQKLILNYFIYSYKVSSYDDLIDYI